MTSRTEITNSLEDIMNRAEKTATYRPFGTADFDTLNDPLQASGRGAEHLRRKFWNPAPQRVPQGLYDHIGEAIDNDVRELKADLRVLAGTLIDFIDKADGDHGRDKMRKHLKDAAHSLRQLEAAIEAFDEAKESAKNADDEDDLDSVAEDMKHYATKAAAKMKFYRQAIGKALSETQDDPEAGQEFDREVEKLRKKYKELKAKMEGTDSESEAKEKEERDRREAEAEKSRAKSYRPLTNMTGLQDFTMSPPATSVGNVLQAANAFGRKVAPDMRSVALRKSSNSVAAVKQRILNAGADVRIEDSLMAQRIAGMLEAGENAQATELLKSANITVRNLFN